MFSNQGTRRAEGIDYPDGLRDLRNAILQAGKVAVDSNSLVALQTGCELGMGLSMLPAELVAPGSLRRLLPEDVHLTLPMWAVMPPTRVGSPKVSLALDALRSARPRGI